MGKALICDFCKKFTVSDQTQGWITVDVFAADQEGDGDGTKDFCSRLHAAAYFLNRGDGIVGTRQILNLIQEVHEPFIYPSELHGLLQEILPSLLPPSSVLSDTSSVIPIPPSYVVKNLEEELGVLQIYVQDLKGIVEQETSP